MEEVNVKFQKIDIDYVLSILSMFCDDKQEQIDNSAISAHFKYELERCSKIIKEIESQKVEQ